MKCPYCNNEMEKGILKSNGSNCFLPDGAKVYGMLTDSSLKKKNAIPLPPSPYGGLFEPVEWPIAFVCRTCKKVIIEIDDEYEWIPGEVK